jgi:hypothetical protein
VKKVCPTDLTLPLSRAGDWCFHIEETSEEVKTMREQTLGHCQSSSLKHNLKLTQFQEVLVKAN